MYILDLHDAKTIALPVTVYPEFFICVTDIKYVECIHVLNRGKAIARGIAEYSVVAYGQF